MRNDILLQGVESFCYPCLPFRNLDYDSSKKHQKGQEKLGNAVNISSVTGKENLEKIISPLDDIEFTLKHFSEPLFPRTISTLKSQGKQFEVFTKESMIRKFEESNFIDCRVNSYPSYTNYKGIQRYPPNFIFADLDLSIIGSELRLERALSATIRNIRLNINGHPTVLWTGNGYHIYQPMDAIILDQFIQFEEFDNPSLKFLRFAENYLTCGKSDPAHYPSFKSCMIRIPGSFNSKYDKGKNEVKIIQKWNGYRPPISALLGIFHAHLVDMKLEEAKLKKRIQKRFSIADNRTRMIHWIEALLQIGISDYRKNTVALILSPYLITIRKMTYDAAFQVIRDWLEKCNDVKTLDSNFSYRIKYSLIAAIRNQRLPMKFQTLKVKNKELFDMLNQRRKAYDFEKDKA